MWIRVLGGICNKSSLTSRQVLATLYLSGEAEAGNAGEQPARNSQTNGSRCIYAMPDLDSLFVNK